MMKKITILIALSGLLNILPAQSGREDNVFSAAETAAASSPSETDRMPADPNPVDAPIPVLLAVAVGLIIFAARRKELK